MGFKDAVNDVEGFINGPHISALTKIAVFANLGLSIATKIDTHKVLAGQSSIRSDIEAVDKRVIGVKNAVNDLSDDIEDFRAEVRYNTQSYGHVPATITGKKLEWKPVSWNYGVQQPQQPQHTQQMQVQYAAPPQQMQPQPAQNNVAPPPQYNTVPIQQPVNQAPAQAPAQPPQANSQYVTKEEFQQFSTGLTDAMKRTLIDTFTAMQQSKK